MLIRMKQPVFRILGALFGVLMLVGCTDASHQVVRGSGQVAIERREVSDFNGVAFYMVGDLEVKIADKEELRIEAEDNLLAYIETEVADGILMVRQRNRSCLRPNKPIRLHITMRELDHVIQAGPGRIHIPRITNERLYVQHHGAGQIIVTMLKVGTLSVHVSGSGDVDLDNTTAAQCRLTMSGSGKLKVRRLVGLSNEVRLTGSGDVSVSGGSVVHQRVFLSGSGMFKGSWLLTSETEVLVSGAGSASIHAKDLLDATITGQGDIRYRGNPKVIQSISNVGKLKRIR